MQCLQNTGGSCLISNCDAWRGATQCSFGRCLCSPGACAGADGKCYAGKQSTKLGVHTIRNVKWPEYYMYSASYGSTPGVSTDNTTGQSKFVLWQLPDGTLAMESAYHTGYALTILKESIEKSD